MKKLRIYIADDHTFVRKGMIRLLKTFERVILVKEAPNGKELLKMVKESPPNAVILDLEMPVMSGTEAAQHLINQFPNVKILVLTMHTEDYYILNLMEMGVHGFLDKNTEPEEVERALYSVIDKDFYRNQIINDAMRNGITKKSIEHVKLTPREVEILLLICKEQTPTEISDRLSISEKTFFNHRVHILEKINGKNNVSIVKFAYEYGLMDLISS